MKTILAILLTSIMMSCNVDTKVSNTDSNEPKAEKIIGEVGHGLYKVQLNDSTTVLIYRGVESCTMIQLK
jgi:hypothetical protein